MEISCHTCVQDENGRFSNGDRKTHFPVLGWQAERTMGDSPESLLTRVRRYSLNSIYSDIF